MLQGLFSSPGWESSQDYYDKAKDEMQTWKDVLFPFHKSRRQDAKHWNKLPKATREDTRAETKSSEAQTHFTVIQELWFQFLCINPSSEWHDSSST